MTAQAARLTVAGHGWRRVGGSTFAWHDHRLAPPPYDGGRTGTVARFVLPATLDGSRVTVGGTFVRYRRPSPWPWLAAAAAVVAAAVAAGRFLPSLRSSLALVLGALAGLAAVTAFVTSASPTLRTAGGMGAARAGIALAAAVAVALVRLDGERRVVLAVSSALLPRSRASARSECSGTGS